MVRSTELTIDLCQVSINWLTYDLKKNGKLSESLGIYSSNSEFRCKLIWWSNFQSLLGDVSLPGIWYHSISACTVWYIKFMLYFETCTYTQRTYLLNLFKIVVVKNIESQFWSPAGHNGLNRLFWLNQWNRSRIIVYLVIYSWNVWLSPYQGLFTGYSPLMLFL